MKGGSFIPEVSLRRIHFSGFSTDDLKMALQARKLFGAFKKRAPGAYLVGTRCLLTCTGGTSCSNNRPNHGFRESRQKLYRLYGNPMANNSFKKWNFTQVMNRNVRALR